LVMVSSSWLLGLLAGSLTRSPGEKSLPVSIFSWEARRPPQQSPHLNPNLRLGPNKGQKIIEL
jgi:hypothetical protein